MNLSELTAAVLAHTQSGGRAVLCTIVESSGSVPRGPGARMAMLSGGGSLGTVGGGRIEYMAQQHALAMLQGTQSAAVEHYTLLGEESNTGMACGGEATICFQLLDEMSVPMLESLLGVLRRGRPAMLALDLTGEAPAMTVGEAQTEQAAGLRGGIYREWLCTDGTVYVFGAGHVSQALTPVLSGVGFRVVVFDARAELARKENFPTAAEIIVGAFDRVAEFVHVTENDYVVVMTPGHQDDQAVLEQTLGCGPAYIGCMGSRRKKAAVWEMLEKCGYSRRQIDCIHLPIGLEIHAETPAEIAISIAGELIAFRAQKSAAQDRQCPA